MLNLETTDGGTQGGNLSFYHNSSSPADSDNVGIIGFYANDSGATSREVGDIRVSFDDVTATEMDSQMEFCVMSAVNASGCNSVGRLTNTGVWTDASSFAELKIPERELTTKAVLTKLRTLDVYRFRGVGRPDIIDTERHISPTADDFYNAFKAGKDPRVLDERGNSQYGIAARDVAGVGLMAIQELIKENDKLKERLDVLEITVLQ